MTHVYGIIQREVRDVYRPGYTVSDCCSSVKMKHRNLLEEYHIGENELFDVVREYLICNTQIEKKNIR